MIYLYIHTYYTISKFGVSKILFMFLKVSYAYQGCIYLYKIQ